MRGQVATWDLMGEDSPTRESRRGDRFEPDAAARIVAEFERLLARNRP
jgi:hypothetical protein